MLDQIGCPLTKGATVLTTGYGSSSLNTIATVEKVNKKSVSVVIKASWWDYEKKKVVTEYKKMRRQDNQVVVIDQQLAYIEEHFPENLL